MNGSALPKVSEIKVDDVSWGMFGPRMRQAVEARQFFGYRVVVLHDPPTKQAGTGTQSEVRFLSPGAHNIDLIAEADAIVCDLRMLADGKEAPEWDHPWPETRVRIEGALWGGQCWVPLAEIPLGEDRSWRLVSLVWPASANGRAGWWARFVGLVSRLLPLG